MGIRCIRQVFKYLILLIVLIITGLSCFALDKYIIYPYDNRLVLISDTYRHNNDIYYGCFAYMNDDKAKLNGKIFMSEELCITYNQTANSLDWDKATFHFLENTRYSEVRSKPYYFENNFILDKVVYFLVYTMPVNYGM